MFLWVFAKDADAVENKAEKGERDIDKPPLFHYNEDRTENMEG